MAEIPVLLITVAGTLLGSLIPTTASLLREHEAAAERQRYRNHEKRTAIADEHFQAFSRFRRSIRDHVDQHSDATYNAMVRVARELEDSSARLKLYFDESVDQAESEARRFMRTMQFRAEDMARRGDSDKKQLEELDNLATKARDRLIAVMRPQLGETVVRERRR
jgi:hypothetical protein